MTEATGFEAKTIHRLLEVNPKNAEWAQLGPYCGAGRNMAQA